MISRFWLSSNSNVLFVSTQHIYLHADVDVSQDRSKSLNWIHLLGPSWMWPAGPFRANTHSSPILASLPPLPAALLPTPACALASALYSLPHAESLGACPRCPVPLFLQGSNPTQPCNYLLGHLPWDWRQSPPRANVLHNPWHREPRSEFKWMNNSMNVG